MTTHSSPCGRRFRIATARCECGPPCWCAWCQCGTKLTAHAFDEAGAVADALHVLASADPRAGFGHARCGR